MGPEEKVVKAFKKRFRSQPVYIGRAPGRVNLMGEHVDYNDGFVLPAAIDRWTTIAFSPSGSADSIILAADYKREIDLTPGNLESRQDASRRRLPGWALYPAGILWAASIDHLPVPGLNAAFASDVPRGAGLSSSASVEIAFCKAWQVMGDWASTNVELARLAQRAESQYVGVRCGIMDQYASACGKHGHAIFLDCRDLSSRYVALPPEVGIVLADSGVRHSLADGSGSYNERHLACEEAICLLRKWLPGIGALRDVPMDAFEQHAGDLPENIRQAARHVVGEIERTRLAVEQLETGDVSGFGKRMLESHVSLRDLYHVSCPELDTLVRIAVGLPGCLGARLTGAGFGGCTVNLVLLDQVKEFISDLKYGYQLETGIEMDSYLCQTEDGASVSRLK